MNASLHPMLGRSGRRRSSNTVLAMAAAALAGSLFLAPVEGFAQAAKSPNCAPSTAGGKPPPPKTSSEQREAFRILWHVATQMEDLADQSDEVRQTIAGIQKDVDGYYITIHPSQVGYFPGRPAQCRISFPRARATLGEEGARERRQDCQRQFDETIARDTPKEAGPTAYLAGLRRVVSNLDLKTEQARGKTVIGQMLLRNDDFVYDKEKQRLVLKKLPTTYCFLNSVGILPNNVMTYQEPRVQLANKNFLVVPARGRYGDVDDPRRTMLPFNLRAIELLGDSFAEANVPLQNFSVVIRRWNERMIRSLQRDAGSNLGGFFFEGGAEIISTKRRSIPRIDNFAEGIGWLLKNTQYPVFVLMPGFWEQDHLTSDADKDELIERVRKTITELDKKIAQSIGADQQTKPICNDRLSFIPGSYGSPEHVKPLPPERDGKLAGTVSGQIKLLAQMRREMCGGAG